MELPTTQRGALGSSSSNANTIRRCWGDEGGNYLKGSYQVGIRGGCARVIECNRSSSAHHRVCTFFPSPFNPVGKGSGHAQTTRDRYGERQSPDGNKRPRGTPTFPTPVRPNSASS